MANDLEPTPRRSLSEQLGYELLGRSVAWWRDKLRKERVRAKTAETHLETIRDEVRGQTERADTAERRVTTLTEDNEQLAREKGELDLALRSVDPDTIFELLVRGWEEEIIDPLNRELP